MKNILNFCQMCGDFVSFFALWVVTKTLKMRWWKWSRWLFHFSDCCYGQLSVIWMLLLVRPLKVHTMPDLRMRAVELVAPLLLFLEVWIVARTFRVYQFLLEIVVGDQDVLVVLRIDRCCRDVPWWCVWLVESVVWSCKVQKSNLNWNKRSLQTRTWDRLIWRVWWSQRSLF